MPLTLSSNQRIQNPTTCISYRLMADSGSWRITRSSPVGTVVALVHLRGPEGAGAVPEDVVARFVAADADNALFFLPALRAGHAMFDLGGFIRMRLQNKGVRLIDDTGLDTYADERFFSYRRSVHRGEPDYGRHIHAIALEPNR